MGAVRSLWRVPVWALALVCLVGVMPATAFAANHNVTVGPGGALSYSPNSITIAAGDSVTFTWDSFDHTVTYNTGPISWVDSGLHDPPFTFVLPNGTSTTVFQSPGDYTYFCGFHGIGMSGTVRVVHHFLVSAP